MSTHRKVRLVCPDCGRVREVFDTIRVTGRCQPCARKVWGKRFVLRGSRR